MQCVTECAHLELECLHLWQACRIQPDWRPPYLLGEHWNGSFCIGSLSVQSVVNSILCLVPPDPCAMPQFYVVRTRGSHRPCTPVCFKDHFSGLPFQAQPASSQYPWPPVAGLQDWTTSPKDCVGGLNQTQDSQHVKLLHNT